MLKEKIAVAKNWNEQSLKLFNHWDKTTYLLEINFWHYTYLTDSNLINVRSLIRKYGWEKLSKINKRTRILIRDPRVLSHIEIFKKAEVVRFTVVLKRKSKAIKKTKFWNLIYTKIISWQKVNLTTSAFLKISIWLSTLKKHLFDLNQCK